MKILELLLPKSIKDKDISPKHAQKIDNLQQRMNKYVDKIGDPSTTDKAREFLKAKLRKDYDELKDVIETVTENLKESDIPPVEPIQPVQAYEVVDLRTGKVIGKPYNSRSRARSRADKLDNDFGAYRYKVRPVGSSLTEAVHKLPLTDNDFDLVKQLMCHPIPAIVAPIYLQEIFDDDEFNSMLQEWEETNPSMDVRPQVVEWFKRVMPDQMHRFTGAKQSMQQKMGLQSVIHGYDPHMYHGTNDPITGDAYGRVG